jgi:hypothetical protein
MHPPLAGGLKEEPDTRFSRAIISPPYDLDVTNEVVYVNVRNNMK